MSDNKIIFSMAGVSKTYPPKKQVLKNIYLSFFYGAKIGILGLNGSGKSSLLKIIAGEDTNYQGEVVFSPGYTVGYLPQEPQLDPDKTVIEVVREGAVEINALMQEFDQINASFADPALMEDPDAMQKLIDRQGEVQELLDQKDAWTLDSQLEQAMEALRCPPNDAKIGNLSGGEKRRVALCQLLIQAPDVLLLDEPTNHLDAESVHWLENHLKEYKGTVICVTHDRYFLDHVAGWILELDRGEGIPFEGNYSSWLDQKQKRLAQEEKSNERKQKTLERELEWIRMSPKARQSKGKARLNAYNNLLNTDTKEKESKFELVIPNGKRLGDKVLEFKNLQKGFEDRILIDDLSFILPPNGIIGVVGPNGVGKTTLFKMITGLEQPDNGEIEKGQSVEIAYVDQQHDEMDHDKTVWETISEGNDLMLVDGREVNSRAYVGRFNFSGTDQQKKIGDLSGGERNRVHLAMTLKQGANLLLLDEPTNDLDVNTIRALEDALENFAGSAVIISHDRWFLDRVCTHILAFEDESTVRFFEGNFSDYEEKRREEVGDLIPKRLKYKKLMR